MTTKSILSTESDISEEIEIQKNVSKQYLDSSVLLNILKNIEINVEDLGATDTYDENKILNKILKYSKSDQILLLKSAIQIAIIGAGNRNFGFIRDNGNEVQLITIFKNLNIKYNNELRAKLDDDDITPRRLVRFFRYQIKKFIITTKRPSYLYLKYSTQDPTFINDCFPGAEHLIKDIDKAMYLIQTYHTLDKTLNLNFVVRLNRVFVARKIILPFLPEDIKKKLEEKEKKEKEKRRELEEGR